MSDSIFISLAQAYFFPLDFNVSIFLVCVFRRFFRLCLDCLTVGHKILHNFRLIIHANYFFHSAFPLTSSSRLVTLFYFLSSTKAPHINVNNTHISSKLSGFKSRFDEYCQTRYFKHLIRMKSCQIRINFHCSMLRNSAHIEKKPTKNMPKSMKIKISLKFPTSIHISRRVRKRPTTCRIKTR